MTVLDFIFLIPLAFFIIKGYQRGIIIELVSVIALIFAIVGCMKLTYIFIGSFQGSGTKSEWFPLLAYLFVFILIYLVIYFFGKLLEKFIKTANLNFINRLAGVLLGVFKAVFLFSLLIWLLNMVDIFPESVKTKSITYRYLKPVAPVLIDYVSSMIPVFKDIINQVEAFFDNLVRQHSAV